MPLADVTTGDPHVAAHNAERDVINALDEVMAQKINKPFNPKVGSFLIFDGTDWNLATSRLFEGTGSPEGRVAAPMGSRYVVTGGSAGAVEWLKTTGLPTDNYGWVMLAGDTGWRNISGRINRRGTAIVYTAVLRRCGDVVDLYLDMETPHNDESPWAVMDLPPGFTPGFTRAGLLQGNSNTATQSTSVDGGGTVNFIAPHADTRDRWNGTWTTDDPWPDSLPGTPA